MNRVCCFLEDLFRVKKLINIYKTATKTATKNKKPCNLIDYKAFCGIAGNRTRVQTSN